jgi:hypothetical protein
MARGNGHSWSYIESKDGDHCKNCGAKTWQDQALVVADCANPGPGNSTIALPPLAPRVPFLGCTFVCGCLFQSRFPIAFFNLVCRCVCQLRLCKFRLPLPFPIALIAVSMCWQPKLENATTNGNGQRIGQRDWNTRLEKATANEIQQQTKVTNEMTDRLKPTFLTSSPFLQSFMDSDEEKDVDARDYFTAVYRVGEEGTDYTLEIPKDQASGNAIRKLIQLKYGRDVGTLYYW